MKEIRTGASDRVSITLATSLLSLAAAVVLLPSVALAQRGDRSYTANRFVLTIDGAPVMVRSVEGGEPYGELVSAQNGPDGATKKHIGKVMYSDIVAEVGADDLRDWIAQSWAGKQSPKNGAIISADFNYKSTAERQFMNALITETTIPTLDAASKDAGYLTVKLTPEAVVSRKGTGADVRGAVSPKQKMWMRGNFGFELGDLPTKRVARIDSFTVRSLAIGAPTGEFRTVKSVSAVQFPNLRLSISLADLQPWADWAQSFIVQGQNGDNAEKNGAIVFLSQNMKDEVGRITLSNCGILSLTQPAAQGEAMPRFEVELYCEKMSMENK
jgi:hypothetical protein